MKLTPVIVLTSALCLFGLSAKAQTGPTIGGSVYGGGNNAAVTGEVSVEISAGEVKKNVFGGGNLAGINHHEAATDGTATVTVSGGIIGSHTDTPNTYGIYGGCNSEGNVADKVQVNIQGGTLGRTGEDSYRLKGIYGGGLGASTTTSGNVEVIIGENSIPAIYGDVYGGSALGKVNADADNQLTKVDVKGGTVNGTVYGGGMGAAGTAAQVNGNVEVAINSSVTGGVYGGCNINGKVKRNVTVGINSGTIGTNATTTANVHGGGYGNNTSTDGNVVVNIGAAPVAPATTPTGDAVIWGDVYGGSADGSVNSDGEDHTWVTLYAGTINGSLYGGGLGITNDDCNVNGAVKVTVNGGTVNTTTNTALTTGAVFGCNNAKGSPKNVVQVEINGTAPSSGSGNTKVYALQGVYGGGNLAAYLPTTPYASGDNVYPKVTVNGCASSIKDVYGGGNAAPVPNSKVVINGGDIKRVFAGGNGESGTPAHIGWNTAANPNPDTDSYGTGIASADIKGGSIEQVFGGSNANGKIRTSSALDVNKDGACPMIIGEVYGGGNLAAGNAGSISIGCTGDLVPGNTGQAANPSNIGTTLEGIGTVYGGANAADVSNSIYLQIKKGIVNKVFGGNNTSGAISGTIKVDINQESGCDWYVGEVYGGGNHADYNGTPDVNIINGIVSRNVYGGGNDITGDTPENPKGVAGSDVEMTGGQVLGSVYGGCNQKGTVTGVSQVKIYGGTVGSSDQLEGEPNTVPSVFGGGLGQNTKVNGNVTVTVNKTGDVAPVIYGDVYGGSALGSVNTSGSNTTTVNVLDGTLETNAVQGETENHQIYYTYYGGNVFGGGLGQNGDATKGIVNGKIIVNIGASAGPVAETSEHTGNATIKGSVYGCNNTYGSPKDDVTVNIYGTAHSGTNVVDYTGNDATYALNNVFGGGNNASYTTEGKNMSVNIYGCKNTIKRTFGGGNAAATKSVSTMIQGGRIDEAYGGGNGERGTLYPANVNGTVVLAIHGGNILHTFAGSNQNGTITGGSTVTVDNVGPCSGSQIIDELFCGGNFADVVGNIDATITCTEGMKVNRLYGGCKQANVLAGNGKPGNVHLTVKGGTFHYIYGGSQGTPSTPANIAGSVTLDIFGCTLDNTTFGDSDTPAIFGGSHVNGSIGGKITVNIEEKVGEGYCGLDVELADVYGGGNEAAYPGPNVNPSTTPGDIEVNIKHAKVKNVYGGGLGLSAAVTASPKVNIGDTDANHRAVVLENVYGGGNEAAVTGDTRILLQNRAKVHGNVYGGGNEAPVDGDTKVIVNGVSGN